ncbi:hypothetical protein HB901_10425 [Listeria booriae]|uniref:hypothetical protein n=1 Tax=Listeria booriae TaxID=1552123 RepID=UPI0016275FC0|nr:hypothetical protein [Listeria booriae]MBC1553129.1 hypothetical protein [Listeria booriae]
MSDSYDFARGFNFTGIENIKDILEDGEDFVDSLVELNQNKWFIIDFLPERMENTYIFDSYFDIYHTKFDWRRNKEYLAYEQKFLQAILKIVGYSDDIYIISPELYKEYGPAPFKLPVSDRGEVYLGGVRNASLTFRIKSIAQLKRQKPEKQVNLRDLLKKGLRGQAEVTIFVCDMKLMLSVSVMHVACLIEDRTELLEKIVGTEGLYIRIPSGDRFP